MTPEQIQEKVKAVRDADDKAERAALAFTLGKFPDYWQAEGQAAIRRMEERFAELGGVDGNTERDSKIPGT